MPRPRVVQLSYAFDTPLANADELLERYATLLGWSEALIAAGAARADVLHRFHTDGERRHGSVEIRLRRAGASGNPRPWTRLTRLHTELAAFAPDVVHVNGLVHPWPLFGLRRRLPAGTAIVLQDHGSPAPPRGWRHFVWKRALRTADGFLFTSAAQAEPWIAAGVIESASSVHAVPEASRSVAPMERSQARQSSGLRGRPALLWVGRLDPVKDPLTLLEAFAMAQDALPDATLTLVFHGGALEPDVRAWLALRPRTADRVRLLGRLERPALDACYRAADAFVLASHKEGSGYALIEALSCGLTPVVTNIPSFRALTDDGRLARLFRPGDVTDAAASLRSLRELGGPGTNERLDFFERELSWPAVGRRALAAYEAARTRRYARVP